MNLQIANWVITSVTAFVTHVRRFTTYVIYTICRATLLGHVSVCACVCVCVCVRVYSPSATPHNE